MLTPEQAKTKYNANLMANTSLLHGRLKTGFLVQAEQRDLSVADNITLTIDVSDVNSLRSEALSEACKKLQGELDEAGWTLQVFAPKHTYSDSAVINLSKRVPQKTR